MATIKQSLISVTLFPLPDRAVEETAVRRGVCLTDEATAETLGGKAYNLAKADLLMWLARAPQVTQGGQSYSFTDAQRLEFRNAAKAIYAEYGETDAAAKPIYGYKGSRL